MKKFLKLIVNTVRAYRLSFQFGTGLTLTVAFFFIATSLLPIYQSKVLGDIINRITDSSSARIVLLLIIGYCIIIAVSRFASEFRQYYEKVWTRHFEHKLETMALRKRAEIDIAKYEQPEFQNLVHRAFDSGVWPIYRLVYYQFRSTASLLTIILTSVISSAIDWRIYVIALVSSLPIFFVRIKYGEIMWNIWSENSARQRIYGHLRDQLRSRTAIYQNRNLQASETTIAFADKIYADFNVEQKNTDRNRLKWLLVATSIAAVGYGISIYMVALQVLDGRLSTGTFVFLVSVLTTLISAVDDFLENTSEQLEQNNYATDLYKFFDTKITIKEPANPVDVDLSTPPRIQFENVSFRYDEKSPWVFKDVSFTIEPKEHVALVGENGAGKTTLIKLLTRVYDPTEGTILINGVDLKTISLNKWIYSLSVLGQRYWMHEFLAKDSIAMGRPETVPFPLDSIRDMSTEVNPLVERAAQLSGANKFIEKWDSRYNQQLGREHENGVEPSQGQDQKLAIARQLYRLMNGGQMLILDEPTAAIDPQAEAEIFKSLDDVAKDKNLILISHRFNTVKMADKIVVIEDGKLQEMGSHADLMEKGGVYSKMFNAQAKGFLDGSSTETISKSEQESVL